MRTTQLPAQVAESASPWAAPERTEAGALHAEICERLIELSESKTRAHVIRWLLRLSDVVRDSESTEALWLYLRLSTGDLSQLMASLSEQGQTRSRSKQAEHQEQKKALRVLTRHFPEVAAQIENLSKFRKP